jgi:hypothetical protein
MSPSLDLCINDLFEPGNIPADPGVPPTVPTIPQEQAAAATFPGSGALRVAAGIPGTAYAGAALFAGNGILSARSTNIVGAAIFVGSGNLTITIGTAVSSNKQFMMGASKFINQTSVTRVAAVFAGFIQGV